jgi:hypothetical protein
MSATDCSPDCSCLPSPSEPGKTFCAFIDREKGHTRPCKAECCKNACTGRQPEIEQSLKPSSNPKIPFGFGDNLPISDKPSVKKWVKAFDSDPMYMHTIVTNPGTYTDPQPVKPYPLILTSQPPERPVVEPRDNGPLITFIGTMAVALALLI